MHQETLSLEHVERHVLLHQVQLLRKHLDGDLDRGRLLLLQLLLLKLFHRRHDRMRGLLNLPFYHDDSSLGVDGPEGFFACCPAPLVEEVREHVAMISDEERVGHVGELLRVLLGEVEGGGEFVCDDVVHVVSSTGTWVAQPHHLGERKGGGEGRGGGEREDTRLATEPSRAEVVCSQSQNNLQNTVQMD